MIRPHNDNAANREPYPLDRFIWHRFIPANIQGKDWFIGDIHGYLDKLFHALDTVKFDYQRDRLFATGDLIDRGPKSREVVKLFVEEPWAFSVLGNHEWILVRELEGDQRMIKLADDPICGAEWRRNVDRAELEFLAETCCKNFPISMSVEIPKGTIGLVHASPPISWDLLAGNPSAAIKSLWTNHLWSRDAARNAALGLPLRCEGVTAVVCGHTTFDGLVSAGNVAFIDTLDSKTGAGELTIISAEGLLATIVT